MMGTHKVRIRILNDDLRRTFQGGTVHLTDGIASLPSDVRSRLLRLVTEFEYPAPSVDLDDEHDSGTVEFAGARAFWKIDCLHPTLGRQSDDPADPTMTKRVLTILLAHEL